MKNDLTLRKIKDTEFHQLYEPLIIGEKLSLKQYETILAIAICFINAEDVKVQQFGYRIIVEYCNQTRDYRPLYEIAINVGLYPVSKFIEQHYIEESERNFFTEWNDAFTEQYFDDNKYQSEQQKSLVEFFRTKKEKTISVIAPTSYGKSELILSAVKEYKGRKICVLTSTKALLMQTKKRIQDECKGIFPKIVVHPEMYNSNDTSCLAVLTQERLLRLFKTDPNLSFDCVIVDEAHEMLEKATRSQILVNVILVAKKRNPQVSFKFLTPFLADSNNLKTRYITFDIEGFKVKEYIKTEKYFLYDLRKETGLRLYDQFLDDYITVKDKKNLRNEEIFVRNNSAGKNIIYLNKPKDIEEFALSLSSVLDEVDSEEIQKACDSIEAYMQPQYNLLACLRKGVIYHHGSVPDTIRIFIENLYRNNSAVRYVVTSSTLLSGVNLPAERMFILDNRRGGASLSYDSFKNLVGRVCRFSEIFDAEKGDLNLLEPHIYLVFGKYFKKNANCQKYLKEVAKVDRDYKDKVENVLLKEAKLNSKNEKELEKAEEFLENYEKGIIENYQGRQTNTDCGKICILNGVTEFGIFFNEDFIQEKVDDYKNKNHKVSDSNSLLEMIYELFIRYIPDKEENIARLKMRETQKFYSMLFDWRRENKSYAEMIHLFVYYWKSLLENNRNTEVYVGKWGDIWHKGSNAARYTKLRGKNESQLINLAIVRIKEEQDFIDNSLIKYVEVLHDLDLIEARFYAQIKYGTEDERTICLIKNGLSLSSANLLTKKYSDYFSVNIATSTIKYDANLISKMEEAEENPIQIYEIESCM
ncbi:MAG: DEAD/DEAH box helicase [Candidatus Ornithospirochaeta sp.]